MNSLEIENIIKKDKKSINIIGGVLAKDELPKHVL